MNIKKFNAKLLQNGDMDAAYIEIPFDVEKEYQAKRVKIHALLNGVEYRGSLVRMKTTCHILGIPKIIRAQMKAKFGDIIHVEMQKDEEERVINIPDDLKAQLNDLMLKEFLNFSYSQQKKYVMLIENAKQEETRLKNIKKIITDIENRM